MHSVPYHVRPKACDREQSAINSTFVTNVIDLAEKRLGNESSFHKNMKRCLLVNYGEHTLMVCNRHRLLPVDGWVIPFIDGPFFLIWDANSGNREAKEEEAENQGKDFSYSADSGKLHTRCFAQVSSTTFQRVMHLSIWSVKWQLVLASLNDNVVVAGRRFQHASWARLVSAVKRKVVWLQS